MRTLVLFNNKGGVGKTSLVYHLAWMYSDLGANVLAADLDPQANLTSMFLHEDRLEELWPDDDHPNTILGAVAPILRGLGDIRQPHVERITDRLGLISGDLGLSRFEAKLSDSWPRCMDGDEASFRAVSSFYRIIQWAAEEHGADLAIVDVGPNLGAINRTAIITADRVAVPLSSDLFSLQGLKNLGPTLREWRTQWEARLGQKPNLTDLKLPGGEMTPIGYVILQHAVRLDRPVKAYQRWTRRIPTSYREEVLGENGDEAIEPSGDPHCLAMLKNYRSLMPLAQDALKPMFHLRAADGALGGHANAVHDCYEDFRRLAMAVAEKCEVDIPAPHAAS